MGVKRFHVLLVGLLVLAGLCATEGYAQPTIKLLKLEAPDTNINVVGGQSLLGIGGKIRVRVETLDAARTVVVSVLSSKGGASAPGGTTAGATGAWNVTGLDSTAVDSVQIGGTTVERNRVRVSGQESTVGTVFTAYMAVNVTAGTVDSCIIEARSVSSGGVVGNDATSALNKVTSLTSGIGDGRRFAVDGDRPVITGFIDSVVVAGKAGTFFPNNASGVPGGAGGVADTVGIGKVLQFKVGLTSSATGTLFSSTLSTNANNRNIDAYAVAVRADTITFPQPSGYQRDFSKARIAFNLSATDVAIDGKRTGSYTVTEGKFGDFKKIIAEAFVIDRAGNLSGASADATTPSGVTSSYTFRIDDKYPKFVYGAGLPSARTTYPDSTGRKWTGGSVAVYDTVTTGGTLANATQSQMPLKFKVDEDVDSVSVRPGSGGLQVKKPLGGQTYVVDSRRIRATGANMVDAGSAAPVAAGSAATLDTKTTGAIGTAGVRVDSAGTSGGILQVVDGTYSVRFLAYDFAGNVKDTTIASAVYDNTPIAFKGQFPRKAAVDTINAATANVVFTLSEPADSVQITYRQISGTVGRTVTAVKSRALGGEASIDLDKTSSEQRVQVNTDSLIDQNRYTLQLFGRDRATNFTATGPDTLYFKRAFQNPNADTIAVELGTSGGYTSNDTVVVSDTRKWTDNLSTQRQFGAYLRVAARDTLLKSTAITYAPATAILEVWSSDTTQSMSTVRISGTGVTEVSNLVAGRKQALLDKSGWVLGERFVTITNKTAQNQIFVSVRDTASAGKKGTSLALVFEAGGMSQFKLAVAKQLPSSVADTSDVQANQPFVLNVQPQDQWGNPSLKQNDDIYTGTKGGIVLSGGNAISQLYFEFSSDKADMEVPAGPQRITSTGWTSFQLYAPNRNDQFTIMARVANVAGSSTTSTGGGAYATAAGRTWVRVVGAGGAPPPTGDQGVMKPDTLIVEDYRGPDGSGDQGGFVLVTFKNTKQHDQLAQYRIWREILVSTGYDTATMRITAITPAPRWVPWAVVDAVPVLAGQPPITRSVVPTIDNVATRWAITAEMGKKSSEAATSSAVGARVGKVVFSEESVKETLELLGIQSAMLQADLEKVISPSYDFMQALLGGRKDLLYGRLDLDGLRQVAMRVPEGVRAQTAAIRASDATLAAAAVRAIDNIPPAAVSNEAETHTNDKREVTLTWKASVDDRVVGFIPYKGYAVPILGVRTYDVLRGANEQSLVKVASLASGTTSFKDVVDPGLGNNLVYRIDATDLDNITKGKNIPVAFQVGPVFKVYKDAQGRPVYLMLPETDPSFNLTEDFDDFFAFADSFGKKKGDPGFNIQADVDQNGEVNFDDFFAFADAFGRVAVKAAGKPVARLAPVFGVNRDAGLDLKLASERVIAGQPITLEVAVSNATALKGYGFTLTYDPQKFELVEASAGDQNLLSQGGSTPVFLKHAEPGRVQLANAITDGGAVSGSGSVARLVFNVKGEFTDITRFEIADGVLVDGSRLTNPVVTLGALNIQTTPTEFALLQNFPNPFNPETTIKYDLAEGGRVELRIYNMVGQVVRTLVNERQNAGRYSIRWDGKDDRGLSVSSGIYFYRLTTEKFNSVKKLMLLK